MVDAGRGAEGVGAPMLEKAPLEHWIQRYAQHRRNELLELGSSDAEDSPKRQTADAYGPTDPCWLGLQRLHRFLELEKPALLYDLNQQQQLCRSRESAVLVLDSLAAARVDAEGIENNETRRPPVALSRVQRAKLHDALHFYLSMVPVESRPSNLASFQELLARLESADGSSSDLSEDMNARTGGAEVLAFLMHLESFLVQTMGEQAYRREQERHGSPSSASSFSDASDEPATGALQDWVQVVASFSSALSNSSSPTLPTGTTAWMKGENEAMVLRLSQSTTEQSLTMQRTVQRRHHQAVADRDAARQRCAAMERRWEVRAREMSELRRGVEKLLTAALLPGSDKATLSPHAPPAASDPGEDVAPSPGARRASSVRISDEELLQSPTTGIDSASSRPHVGAGAPAL